MAQVFLGSAVIGEYLPQTPKDEAFAAQATDYVNYLVLRECNGHAVLKTALHEALLLGNGVLKHWWDKTAKERVESFTGLDEDGVTAVISRSTTPPQRFSISRSMRTINRPGRHGTISRLNMSTRVASCASKPLLTKIS